MDAYNKVIVFCPDCRGRLEVAREDFVEDDILECELCTAEIQVVSEDPVSIKLYKDEEEF